MEQKKKFPVLVKIGIVILVLSLTVYVINIIFLNLFYSKFPEIKQVKTEIKNEYPDGSVQVNINTFTDLKSHESTQSIIVVYDSKKELTTQEIQRMGIITCESLQKLHKKYGNIVISNRTSMLPLNIPIVSFTNTNTSSATCDEWKSRI